MDDDSTSGSEPPAPDLASTVRNEQRRRWAAGDRVPAEDLLNDHPSLSEDPQAAVDVIYGEYFLRESLGERPDSAEYIRRFPAYARILSDQFALHLAMETVDEPSRLSISLPKTSAFLGDETDLPEMFGRYRIVSRIGRGGMGIVYLAHDSQLDRQVALKIPRFDDDPDGRATSRFRREAKIAATFSHPNLCPIFDVGEHEGIVYLTMPLIQGETLASRLGRDPGLPEVEITRIAAKVSHAIMEAHTLGVIHRDLKPANIMIDRRGEPIVMDFGLARSDRATEESATPAGMVLGTPSYMAPEQIGGVPNDHSSACDVYALGVILYQMLAGRLPYLGTVREVLEQATRGNPERPSTFRPGISPWLETVCLTAMSREPKDRYPTMAAMADALETGGLKTVPKKRRLMRVAIPIAILLIVAAIFAFRTRPKADSSWALTPGSRWIGAFAFRPPSIDYRGDIIFKVTERNGSKFTGIYATEGGKYTWECQGEIHGDAISWSFTRIIREMTPTKVVGFAHVNGRIDGESMKNLVFIEPGDGTADLSLTRIQHD